MIFQYSLYLYPWAQVAEVTPRFHFVGGASDESERAGESLGLSFSRHWPAESDPGAQILPGIYATVCMLNKTHERCGGRS